MKRNFSGRRGDKNPPKGPAYIPGDSLFKKAGGEEPAEAPQGEPLAQNSGESPPGEAAPAVSRDEGSPPGVAQGDFPSEASIFDNEARQEADPSALEDDSPWEDNPGEEQAADAAAISTEISEAILKKGDESAKRLAARREHTRKTLVIYAILMAGFVLVLILISYLNQLRSEDILSQTIAKLDSSEAYAEGVEKNIALVQEENVALKKQLAAVSARYDETTAALENAKADISRLDGELLALAGENAEARIEISDIELEIALLTDYSSLLTEYTDRDYKACREIIKKMEAGGLTVKLSEENLKKYQQIKRRVE